MSQSHDIYSNVDRVASGIPVRVRDLMNADPVTVEPTATVKEIAQVLLNRDIRSVPVVDFGGQLVGIVSEADLVCREGYPTVRHHSLEAFVDEAVAERHYHWSEKSKAMTAGDLMTEEVVICTPAEPIAVVARRMLVRGIRTLPVVDEGFLVGMISRHDLLWMLNRPDPEIRDRLNQLLADPLWAPEGHHVEPEVFSGVVILRGTVRHPSDINLVCSDAQQVPGVLEVISHLTAESPEPKPSYLHDTDWR
jgi:CBS domain-containing protein